ncbi:LacI family DNA-binding transcriptional regulator [Modestobacter sp. VKM Ac-2985]|uniref:LacI family DNA-binding transcriptional regulator n=1 Tax=Modestobacter sp. VKM Ac-2985 TaxID=3004139 RepID=UPI0022ABA688|nr:LacI family DNA-binding transcriptional regulator [Modestobacter sp. VKM Ac-2985]MCZ2839835.1 LacI family DNA-binding transcriptional regulator [Modestobacter sp. VKM Ac-2985]
MPATLNSVAAAAGVSTSTASRALSGHPAVLPSTRARVEAAAAALQYQPNRTASALRTRRTGLLGLVVNSLRTATFHTIAETLQSWAAGHDYQVLVCTTGGDPAREAAFLQMARQHHFDGVVIAGSGANTDLVNVLLQEGRAVVTMNREVPGSLAPSVMSAYETAARMATEHLLQLGHTRIAAIEGPPEVTSGRLHHAGFLAAMAAAGVPVHDELVCRGPFTPDFGRWAATQLLGLTEPPTALLVTNHEASFGALPVVGDSHLRVPGQLSVICTEDEPFYQWWSPPVTTVDNRAELLATSAAGLLLSQLTAGSPAQPAPRVEVVPPVLVARGTTAPPA